MFESHGRSGRLFWLASMNIARNTASIAWVANPLGVRTRKQDRPRRRSIVNVLSDAGTPSGRAPFATLLGAELSQLRRPY
jgi:hypothetical protein